MSLIRRWYHHAIKLTSVINIIAVTARGTQNTKIDWFSPNIFKIAELNKNMKSYVYGLRTKCSMNHLRRVD